MSQLSSEERRELLGIARRAISTAVIEERLLDLTPVSPNLNIHRSAFVTLFRNGRLRGCVGQIENPGPLVEGVVRAAINAALHDPRFAPVTADEIALLEIEISVLSTPEEIGAEEIVAGHHGVLVVHSSNRGLLLPRVAMERGWSGLRLLEETCVKAGLARDAWQDPETQILVFTAEVFSETEIRTTPGA